MRGKNTWDYKPYTRLSENAKKTNPYICRIAPYKDYCEVEWFDKGCNGGHTLFCRQYGTNKPVRKIALNTPTVCIEQLDSPAEYEIYIQRDDDPAIKSDTRRFRTGGVPGTIVNYLHPMDNTFDFSGHYLCSPCIIKTPTGRLLVSMDVYGPRHAQNLTFIYKSDDSGKTWQYLTDLFPCFWGKLFVHRNRVYMLAVSSEYGNLIIGCSEDDGEHWSAPVTLFPGCGIRDEDGMHQAPTPVICHNGRLWSAVDYGTWEKGGHASALVSVPEDADLLNPENWVCSEFVPFNHDWPGAVPGSRWGCLEGNAVAGPDGEVYNMLRYQISNVFKKSKEDGAITHGKALLLKIDQNDPEKPLSFHKFIDFNGGMSKFVVRRDEVSNKYISLVNKVVDDSVPAQRNILSLAVSDDLENWRIVKDLIDASDYSPEETGFQYVDFIFDGDDIIYVSRTAFNHAHNFHDANYITFYREKNFRTLL